MKVQKLIKSLLLVFVLSLMLLGVTQVYASTMVDPVTTDEAKVDYDLNAIKIKTRAIASFPVTYKSAYGSTITYTSTNNEVVDVTKIVETNGWVIVNRSPEAEQYVTITVSVTLGSVTKEKSVDVTVPQGTTNTKAYQVTYDLNGVPAENTNPTTQKAGQYVALTALSAEDYCFDGWYSDAALTKKITCLPIGLSSNITIYAKWTAAVVTGLEISTLPTKVVYNALENFDGGGMEVYAIYNNNTSKKLSETDYQIDKTVLHGTDTQVVVSYSGFEAIVDITVNKLNYDLENKEVTSIFTYDGENHNIIVTGLPSGLTAEFSDNEGLVNAGSKEVTINYVNANETDYNNVASEVVNLVVNKRAIEFTIDNKTHVYGEEFKELTYTKTSGEIVEGDTVVITPEITDKANDVATYVITAAPVENDNYEITIIDGEYSITKASIEVKVVAVSVSKGEAMPDMTYTVTGLQYGETAEVLTGEAVYTGVPADTNTIGTYDISISGLSSDNYEITFTASTLRINDSTSAVTGIQISQNPTKVIYDALEEFDATGMVVEIVYANGSQEITTDYQIDKTVLHGTDTQVVVSYSGFEAIVDITVNKLNYDLENKEVTSIFTYDGENHNIIVTGLPSGLTAELSDNEGLVNAGSKEVTINYVNANETDYNNVASEVVNLVVNKRVIEFTIDNKTHVYGEEFKELTYTKTSGEIVEGDTVVITPEITDKANDVATYVITAAPVENDNYEITIIDGEYSITKATLNVKINDITMLKGTAEQVFGYTSTPEVLGLTLEYYVDDELVESIDLSTYAAGTYTITATISEEPTNYTVVFTDGTLTINISDEEAVELDAEQISNAYSTVLTGEISEIADLIVEGNNGSTITWTSDNTGVTISDLGVVSILSTVLDQEVTLTAEIAKNDTMSIIAFTFKIVSAQLETYSITFTDKDFNVGDGELAWTSTVAGNAMDSASNDRGVQIGTAKGIVNISSVLTNIKVSTVTLVLSTNETGNTAQVKVGETLLNNESGNTDAVTIVSGTANKNKEYTFTAADILSGQITIIINDAKKSVYIKQIIINK